MFADRVEIQIKAGKGGDGRLGFRHEKYRAKGGPDGGDGGRGGDVVLKVSHNLNTLSAYRRQQRIQAEDGQAGGSDRKHGRNGEDVIVAVPQGTQVYVDGELVADLIDDEQTAVIARGGRGGFGNAHFTSSVRQAPRATELGEMGEHFHIRLELKLVADIGLVGLPNAGKSTLLSVISNAKPEIGDYPFTTLTPNLGVTDIDDTSVLVADIPGLIEGASDGKGLGDEFLRHIERTAVLLHLVDAYSDDVTRDYRTIQNELRNYSIDLTPKPQLVVLTKVEGIDHEALQSKRAELHTAAGSKVYAISATAHEGIDELLRAALPLVVEAREKRAAEQEVAEVHIIDESTQPDLWQVTKEGKAYVVSGENIEGFARRTDWDNDASVERFRDILHKQGVAKELARQGIESGNDIRIGDHTIKWLG